MARKAILDTYYTFSPSSRTIVIPHAVPKERLVLITDVTTNQVIYNFSDPNLTTTAYSISLDTAGLFGVANATTITTLTLNYNTTGLSSTDKLQIVVDEYAETFQPAETYLDPINKLRVSTPQSLIDTDYEYSIQTTKWEQLAMINNIPYAYYVTATGTSNVINVTANVNSRVYTANVYPYTPPAVGNVITILDTLYAGADGTYIVDSNNISSNTFSYTGKYYYTGTNNNQTIYNPGVTIAYNSFLYSNASIALASVGTLGNVLTFATTNNHNLAVGNEVALTGANTNNGSFTVISVPSQNTFTVYSSANAATFSGLLAIPAANLYVRPQGLALHRSFDGGVRFSTNAASSNNQYIRQTRRYFRYQSGKGIQMSTGTTLKPQLNLDGISSAGTTLCTVITKDPHNIVGGSFGIYIAINGADQAAYNGVFQILNVINPYTFTYLASSVPPTTQASGPIYGSIYSWYGATNRIGIFDSQNGLFWQFDGQTLSVTRRSSVFQVSGQIQATPGSTTINASTGYPTYFSKQLSVGDFVVIKGMSYRVANINSDQQLTISPAYRGLTTLTNAVLSRTVDLTIPQSQFNIDRLDGTGPSGYTIDLTKMQMFYIDYSWYGAGFIRFGVRASDGNVVYCHKIINNNVNYLAYMRSGNLPGRYETNTFAKTTNLLGGTSGVGTNFLSTDSIMYVGSTAGFPNTGTIWVRTANNGGLGNSASEFINYTSITANSFTGLTRGQAGNSAIYVTALASNNILTLAAANGTTGVQVGQYVFGNAIPNQAFVTSFVPNTSITISQAAIGNTTANVIFVSPLSNVAQTFIYSATAQTAVELHSPVLGPEINHWGTSAIMDGQFTADKSFIFTKGMTSAIAVPSTFTQAVMSFRISPSASNGIAGSGLGIREIINRMQHLPFEADVYANGSFLMTCILNGTTSNQAENWQSVGGSSLSQYIFHGAGTTITGGEPVFGFYLNTAQGTYATTQQDLTQLLALGTNILGGGTANAASGIYPNGPDVITFVAQNIDTASRSIQARYSWNEAQA